MESDKHDFLTLVQLWVLGEDFAIPALQNLAMRVLYEKQRRLRIVPLMIARYVYENTSPGSLLRRFGIDMCVWRGIQNPHNYRARNLPAEMLLDLVVDCNIALSIRCDPNSSAPLVNPMDNVKNYLIRISENGSLQKPESNTSNPKKDTKPVAQKDDKLESNGFLNRVGDIIGKECQKSGKAIGTWFASHGRGENGGNLGEHQRLLGGEMSEVKEKC